MMQLPVFVHDECGPVRLGFLGRAVLPISAWLTLVKVNPRLRSKSIVEIHTFDRTFFVEALPAVSPHQGFVEIFDACFVKEARGDIDKGFCIFGKVWLNVPSATSVTIECQELDLRGVRELLYGRIICKGSKTLSGPKINLEIHSIEPASYNGPMVFVAETKCFMIKPEQLDVGQRRQVEIIDGGAAAQIEEIIVASQNSTRNRPIPRGILLHGPPGVGKTFIVKSVCDNLDVPLTVINGPEIISATFGQSEANLREIFSSAAAKDASGVLFMDEIDSIAGRQSDESFQQQRRLFAELLHMIDSYSDRLVIIAATNRPNAIDPALRRPGRFDREIHVEPPGEELRKKILVSILGNCTLETDVKEIAKRTVGYVPADLAALCHEMLLLSSREQQTTSLISQTVVERALTIVGPSLNREYRVNFERGLNWDDIGGLDAVKDRLHKAIEWPLKYEESFKRMGLKSPRGILLYGPPGCSKTTIAKVLANSAGFSFYSLSGAAIYSAFVGEAERLVRQLFQCARMTPPALIFIDEIDALVGKRGADADVVQERILSTLLNEMDGVEKVEKVIVLGATNRKHAIDEALLRPGRFDILIEVPLPNRDDRLCILKAVSRHTPISPQVDLTTVADKTQGCSGADLKNIIQEAALMAIRRGHERVEMDDIIVINCK